jgi:indole-3-glycerol phosphate synthase
MATILDKILATKRDEVASAKQRLPIESVRAQASETRPPLDFAGALRRVKASEKPDTQYLDTRRFGTVRLIAEVKKASPSAGIIRQDFDPVQIAKAYAASGASCISVLTDEPYFQGHLDFLRSIRAEVAIPLLRKDFIIDPYQVFEARAAGADCVLLIAECLTPNQLSDLHNVALELGMATLIELYDPENLPAVLATGGEIIGVNNRDLRSFVTELEHTIRLRSEVPADRILVGESGIRTHDDVLRLAHAGVDAMLVGESLMRQACIESAVAELLFGSSEQSSTVQE